MIKSWAEQQLNVTFGNCYTLANIYEGEIGAVIVLNNFRRNSAEISAIINKHGLSKIFLKCAADYIFNFCNFQRLTAFVSPENQQSIRILSKFGFKREGLQRCAADSGGDLIMYGLLKSDCRWLS